MCFSRTANTVHCFKLYLKQFYVIVNTIAMLFVTHSNSLCKSAVFVLILEGNKK